MGIDTLSKHGRILMLALDHRGSLAKMLPASLSPKQRDSQMIEIKKALIDALLPYYSGVLLDPPIGLTGYHQLIQEGKTLTPYLLCIERSGYSDADHERVTNLEYSVDALKGMGAAGVKLLLFYRPDGKTAASQRALAKRVFDDCRRYNLPFFLELLNYSLDDTPYDPALLVPRSVSDFLTDGIYADVFKLEYPGNAASCREVTRTLGTTPWILLTKGASYEQFVAGLKTAISNGAKGFLAGRSIWQDMMKIPQENRHDFIQDTVVKRFSEICSIAGVSS